MGDQQSTHQHLEEVNETPSSQQPRTRAPSSPPATALPPPPPRMTLSSAATAAPPPATKTTLSPLATPPQQPPTTTAPSSPSATALPPQTTKTTSSPPPPQPPTPTTAPPSSSSSSSSPPPSKATTAAAPPPPPTSSAPPPPPTSSAAGSPRSAKATGKGDKWNPEMLRKKRAVTKSTLALASLGDDIAQALVQCAAQDKQLDDLVDTARTRKTQAEKSLETHVAKIQDLVKQCQQQQQQQLSQNLRQFLEQVLVLKTEQLNHEARMTELEEQVRRKLRDVTEKDDVTSADERDIAALTREFKSCTATPAVPQMEDSVAYTLKLPTGIADTVYSLVGQFVMLADISDTSFPTLPSSEIPPSGKSSANESYSTKSPEQAADEGTEPTQSKKRSRSRKHKSSSSSNLRSDIPTSSFPTPPSSEIPAPGKSSANESNPTKLHEQEADKGTESTQSKQHSKSNKQKSSSSFNLRPEPDRSQGDGCSAGVSFTNLTFSSQPDASQAWTFLQPDERQTWTTSQPDERQTWTTSQPDANQTWTTSQPDANQTWTSSQFGGGQAEASSQPDVGQAEASSQPDVGQAEASSQPDVGQAEASSEPGVGQAEASSEPGVGQAEASSQPGQLNRLAFTGRGKAVTGLACRSDGKVWLVYKHGNPNLDLVDKTGTNFVRSQRIGGNVEFVAAYGATDVVVSMISPRAVAVYRKNDDDDDLTRKVIKELNFRCTGVAANIQGVAYSSANNVCWKTWTGIDNFWLEDERDSCLKGVAGVAVLEAQGKLVVCVADREGEAVHFYRISNRGRFFLYDSIRATDERRFEPISISAHNAGYVGVLDSASRFVYVVHVQKERVTVLTMLDGLQLCEGIPCLLAFRPDSEANSRPTLWVVSQDGRLFLNRLDFFQ